MSVYYHGGRGGLQVGDVLLPAPPHVEDGCPICAARKVGRRYTVREARAWALSMGAAGEQLLKVLEDAPAGASVDPPAERQQVYVTTSRLYARWYAARSRGDLYRVAPVGRMTPSATDHFPSFTVESARVVEVLGRNVFLLRAERRELSRQWRKADRLYTRPGVRARC